MMSLETVQATVLATARWTRGLGMAQWSVGAAQNAPHANGFGSLQWLEMPGLGGDRRAALRAMRLHPKSPRARAAFEASPSRA